MIVFRPPVVGRRGAVLLFLALLDLVYALSLYRPARAPTSFYRFLADIAPLWVWALLWAGVGMFCLVGAFGRRAIAALDIWPFLAAVAIKVFWVVVIGMGWLLGDIDRGWVSASVWLAFAVLVMILAGWPEPGDELSPPPGTE